MSERVSKRGGREETLRDGNLSPQKTCFAIMPISDHPSYPSGHFGEVYEYLIKPVVEEAGFRCERADTTSASHMIHVEIISKVHGADLCICDLSTRNPNVLYELGIRQAFDKPTVLINDNKTDRIFDVEGFRYSSYNAELRPASLANDRAALLRAIEDTIHSHGKEKQIFSLVSFLGLKAAAVTEIKESPESAWLEIIDRKFNTIMATIERERAYTINERTYMGVSSKYRNEKLGELNLLSDLVKDALKSEPGLKAVEAHTILGSGTFIQFSDGSIIFSLEESNSPPVKVPNIAALKRKLEVMGVPVDVAVEVLMRFDRNK